MDEVKNTLSKCFRCKEYNLIRIKGFKHVEAFEQGEKVAFDIIGPIENKYIITAIDYFSRFAMAKVFDTKSSENVLKFLEIVHKEVKVKTFISDGAKENESETIINWMIDQGIRHHK